MCGSTATVKLSLPGATKYANGSGLRPSRREGTVLRVLVYVAESEASQSYRSCLHDTHNSLWIPHSNGSLERTRTPHLHVTHWGPLPRLWPLAVMTTNDAYWSAINSIRFRTFARSLFILFKLPKKNYELTYPWSLFPRVAEFGAETLRPRDRRALRSFPVCSTSLWTRDVLVVQGNVGWLAQIYSALSSS